MSPCIDSSKKSKNCKLTPNHKFREEENQEVHDKYHRMLREFKQEDLNDKSRIQEYEKENNKLLQTLEEKKLQKQMLEKELADLESSNAQEQKNLDLKNQKTLLELDGES